MKMRRRKPSRILKLKTAVKLVCTVITISFIIIQIMSALQLGTTPKSTVNSPKINLSEGSTIGELGRTVIKMLPGDLAFTLFLPSERAFRRDLRLDRRNDSSGDDAYAVLTRVLGFSAVPRWIHSGDLECCGKEVKYGSISGFDLYVSKDLSGTVVVNGGVASEQVDLKIGNLLVHVMDGVVMDAEFEQSVRDDDDEEDR